MGKSKRLSNEEIDNAVEMIRKKYDDYIVRFMKPLRMKTAFEDRYLDALRNRMDLERFLLAEIQAINEMSQNEEKKAMAEALKNMEKKKKDMKRSNVSGFADKIIEQNKKRIEGYPSLKLPRDSSYEIGKLYGALMSFDREYWPELDKIMRELYTSYYSSPRAVLEPKVLELCSENTQGYPTRLSKYITLLGRFPRNYRELEREEKSCILDAALFLHTSRTEISRTANIEGLEGDDQTFVNKSLEFIDKMIVDFRLNDLKPQR